MTRQQQADALLSLWQAQRAAGIPANDRVLPPALADRAFECDLDVIRQCMAQS